MSRPLLILPPLAFARIGTSAHPVDWFLWGPNDNSLYGTGKTTALRCENLNSDGTPRPAADPHHIVFRDSDGIRPVCPFFELYESLPDGRVTPLTPKRIRPEDVTWIVTLGNLKAYYRTFKEGDKVTSHVKIRATQPGRKNVLGWSPTGEMHPLVWKKSPIRMGSVEVLAPHPRLPFRIRFWAPRGLVYGPTNIRKRKSVLASLVAPDSERMDLVATLNPAASWPRWKGDDRQYLTSLAMRDESDVSLGLMDDTSDGFVECRLADGRRAQARLAVTPPSYAPDRRYLISCADGLKDREDREQSLTKPGATSAEWQTEAEQLVMDILERALETVDFMNLEALVDRYEKKENPDHAFAADRPWKAGASGTFDIARMGAETLEQFPLTEIARQRHRQFVSPDLLRRFIKQRPTLLREMLRPPAGDNQFYNRQMPPLQRGSDARPLHLTRRQYDLVIRWADLIGGG